MKVKTTIKHGLVLPYLSLTISTTSMKNTLVLNFFICVLCLYVKSLHFSPNCKIVIAKRMHYFVLMFHVVWLTLHTYRENPNANRTSGKEYQKSCIVCGKWKPLRNSPLEMKGRNMVFFMWQRYQAPDTSKASKAWK